MDGQIIVIRSLREARLARAKFDVVVLNQSDGVEFGCFHYRPLGLGNLIGAWMGAVMVDKSIPIVSFHSLRIEGIRRLISRNSFQWFTRSYFATSAESRSTSRQRRFLGANVSKQSWIDSGNRVFYLSTDLANVDPEYFASFNSIDREILKTRLKTEWGIEIPNTERGASAPSTLGVHVRQGDFESAADAEILDGAVSNRRVPTHIFLDAVQALQERHSFKRITIYSDNKVLGFSLSSSGGLPHDVPTVQYWPLWKNGISTLNSMMQKESLVIANSTLSFWAGALSGVPTYYILDNPPYSVEGSVLPNFNSVARSRD